jgi:hypothetical protein
MRDLAPSSILVSVASVHRRACEFKNRARLQRFRFCSLQKRGRQVAFSSKNAASHDLQMAALESNPL